jgi:L-lactate dehydrogenase
MGGVPWKDYCPVCRKCDDWSATRKRIEQEVRDSAYHIIGYKGATYYAVGLALVRIVEAILRSQNSVLTVSVRLEGEFGLSDVSLSVPCLVSGQGVSEIVNSQLPEEEQNALENSASILKKSISELAH